MNRYSENRIPRNEVNGSELNNREIVSCEHGAGLPLQKTAPEGILVDATEIAESCC